MNSWYDTLSPRERTLVHFAGVAVLSLLLWMLIIKPLITNHSKLTKVISNQQNALVLMQKQSAEIKQLKQNTKPTQTISGNPQQLIERSLQTWRLKPNLERMQSQGNKGVRLVLKNTNADRFMRFLHEIEDKYALTISNLIISNTKKDLGFADVRLTIKRN